MLRYSVPPGYQRDRPPSRPKLDPYKGVIDQILEEDQGVPKKQRHTAKRIYERLRDEHGFPGKYTIVKDYVRERRRRTREMFVPLSHSPGHAQCDFGEAWVSCELMEIAEYDRRFCVDSVDRGSYYRRMEHSRHASPVLAVVGVATSVIRGTRPRQWTKNLLIFLALFFTANEAWSYR